MNDIKATVAKNIAMLRQKAGMTQLELAEKLNYSDKAISKWERGESMPDVSVLVELCELFGVSLDMLVRDVEPAQTGKVEQPAAPVYRRGVISAVSVMLVWTIAVAVFVLLSLLMKHTHAQWLTFIYALPVSMIVWLVFNSIWFRPRLNYLIVSCLMWSILLSIHLSLLIFGINIWLIYLLGIPGQLIILLWSVMRKRK